MVNECLKAREILSGAGIDAGVVDILTLKPIDCGTVVAEAAKARCVICAENRQINGRLGSAIAEILAESSYGGKFTRIGIMNEFGEVGTQDYLTKPGPAHILIFSFEYTLFSHSNSLYYKELANDRYVVSYEKISKSRQK
jgi:hypothetical protein